MIPKVVRVLVVAALTFTATEPCRSAWELPPWDSDLPEWIISKPLPFGEERVRLALEYAKAHYGMDDIRIVPKMIVVHWTGGKNLAATLRYFARTRIIGRPFLKKYGEVNVAAHYLVGRDGAVYKLLPDTLMGRHVIGLNHCSIGIENVGKNDLTKAQLEANVKLVTFLATRHKSIEFLIGHYEYLKFEGHPLFIERFPEYRTKKSDPGKKFMKELRGRLLALGTQLLGPP